MAFSFTVDVQTPDSCGLAIVTGTYTNTGASTGGLINPPLRNILYAEAICMVSQAGNMNEVVVSGGAFNLTTVANEDGRWSAIGH